MNDKELLEFARKNYPVGTLHYGSKKSHEITLYSTIFKVTNTDFYIDKINDNLYSKGNSGCIYHGREERWATIHNPVSPIVTEFAPKKGLVSRYSSVMLEGGNYMTIKKGISLKEELLLKATTDYPIGTKYFDALNDTQLCMVRGSFSYYEGGRKYKDYITDGYGGTVYCNGKWAEKDEIEIIERPTATI